MKKLYYLIILTVILGLVVTGCFLSKVGQVPITGQRSELTLTTFDPRVLVAGQNTAIGTVTVSDDGTDLTVTYNTIDGWKMTETHLYVGKTDPKSLTSAPGQFPYSEPHSPITSKTYIIALSDISSYELGKGKKWVAFGSPGVGPEEEIYIAAHAEVEKIIESTTPRYPSGVSSYEQGFRWNGDSVAEARSDPEQGLVYELAKVEASFFSLGYGGWIIVEFDCPIPNGEGDDLRIIEDTYSPDYPLEEAEVSASQDGISWVLLGIADNTPLEGEGWHSFSAFDLDGLEWAKYIRVLDITDRSDGSVPRNDGFNLNAVEALQECIEETAWGDGEPIRPDKNWAMYFNYNTIPQIPQCWSLEGEWEITAYIGDFGGSGAVYVHRMIITDDIIGLDYSPPGSSSVKGDINGEVDGSNVEWDNVYRGSSGYIAYIEGTIDVDDRTMNGIWWDNKGKSGEWESTSGVAFLIDCI